MSIYDVPMMRFKDALSGNILAMKSGFFGGQRGAYKNFVKVFDEADEAFNISEQYREYLAKRMQAVRLYAQAVDGKKWLYTQAKIKELEAEALLGIGGSVEDFAMLCAKISKKVGFRVDPLRVTIADFYSYMSLEV